MKKILFLFLIILICLNAFNVVVFAEEKDDSPSEEETIVDEGLEYIEETSDNIRNELGKVNNNITADLFLGFVDEFKGIKDQVWSFLSSNETYKNIFTAILAILGFLFIPILLGVLLIAYLIMAIVVFIVSIIVSFINLIMLIFV
jgi:hypothetical protein